jgi:hypothetical protein
MEERVKVSSLEASLQAVNKGGDISNKLIELTKQNSILDVNLLRLTRKYHALAEQEKLLRRDYHNKDSDIADKDVFVQ